MASRNHYTHTPGYQGMGRGAPPRGENAYFSSPRPAAVRRPVARSRRPAGDTFLLTLLFIVAPLCGILGIFVKTFLWIFIAVTLLVLATMWALRCFEPRGRAFVSGILVVLVVVALVSSIDFTPNQGYFQPYGGDQALSSGEGNPPDSQGGQGNAALGGNADQDAQGGQSGQPAQGGASTWSPGFAGLVSVTPAVTAPIGVPDTGADNEAALAQTMGAADLIGSGQPQPITSAAQEVLENYMQMWAQQNFEDMVQYTTPEWQNVQKVPQRQLSWAHSGWILTDWRIVSEAQSPIADSVTLKVIADLVKNSSTKSQERLEYSALVLNRNGTWYVDPDSMRNGYPPAATATPVPVMTQANDGPSPAPTTDPSLKLWYNSSGGAMYHLNEKCASINPKYYSYMKSFTYSKLGDKDYSNLVPCSVCDAPPRPK